MIFPTRNLPLILSLSLMSLLGVACSSDKSSHENFQCESNHQISNFERTLESYRRGQVSQQQLELSATNTVAFCKQAQSAEQSCFQDRKTYGLCEEAQKYVGHDFEDGREQKSGWADLPVTELRPKQIALRIENREAVRRVVESDRRQAFAFLNGKVVRLNEAEDAARRGDISCRVLQRGDTMRVKVFLPVIEIVDYSRQRAQTVNLMTESGFEASCTTNSRDQITARDIQVAFGSAILIRPQRARR